MGNNQLQNNYPQSKHYVIMDYGYCRVWKSRHTSVECMQEYNVCIEGEQLLQAYRQMWILRARHQHIVSLYYFSHEPNRELCNVSQRACILTERIPYRLSQFSNVPYSEMMSLFKIALVAFALLHAEYGLFVVKSTMVGINNQRQIKVWHHTDLSSPEPENPHCRSLLDMLASIITSIQRNADSPLSHPRFSDHLRAINAQLSGFPESLAHLSSYMHQYRIPVLLQLPRLTAYLREAEGWQELSYNTHFLSNLSKANRLNRSTNSKFSFRDSPNNSLSSSQKTLKKKTINIYTHKEVNRIMDNQHAEKGLMEREKGEKSKMEREKNLLLSNEPMQSKPRSLEPIHIHTVQFKISNNIHKMHFNAVSANSVPSPRLPHSHNSSHMESNFERRIMRGQMVNKPQMYATGGQNGGRQLLEYKVRREGSEGQGRENKSLASSISLVESKQIRENIGKVFLEKGIGSYSKA